MEKVIRFGMSLEPELLRRYDSIIRKKGYANRSEAIRDLIRKDIIKNKWEKPKPGNHVATLTLIYDHHAAHEKLTDLQHHHSSVIKGAMHIHLDENNCLEVLVLQGNAKDIQHLADEIIAEKGVKHGELVLTDSLA